MIRLTATHLRKLLENAAGTTEIIIKDTDGEPLNIGRIGLVNTHDFVPAVANATIETGHETIETKEVFSEQIIIQLTK